MDTIAIASIIAVVVVMLIVLAILMVTLQTDSSETGDTLPEKDEDKQREFAAQATSAYSALMGEPVFADLATEPMSAETCVNTYFLRERFANWRDSLRISDFRYNGDDVRAQLFASTATLVQSMLASNENTRVNIRRNYASRKNVNRIVKAVYTTTGVGDTTFPILPDGSTSVPANAFDPLLICFAVQEDLMPGSQPLAAIKSASSLPYLNNSISYRQGCKTFSASIQSYMCIAPYELSMREPFKIFSEQFTLMEILNASIENLDRCAINFQDYAFDVRQANGVVMNVLMSPEGAKVAFISNGPTFLGDVNLTMNLVYSQNAHYHMNGSGVWFDDSEQMGSAQYCNFIDANSTASSLLVPILGGLYDPDFSIWVSYKDGSLFICNIQDMRFAAINANFSPSFKFDSNVIEIAYIDSGVLSNGFTAEVASNETILSGTISAGMADAIITAVNMMGIQDSSSVVVAGQGIVPVWEWIPPTADPPTDPPADLPTPDGPLDEGDDEGDDEEDVEEVAETSF